MGQGDNEVLVPDRVLGVGDDAGAGDGGAGDGDGDVGVAGDGVVVAVAGGGGGGGDGALAGREAAAEVVGDDVHVGEAASFVDLEVEVAMEEHEVFFVVGH